jgi:hypothetical protein
MTGFLIDEQLPIWWPSAILALYPHLSIWIIGDGIAPPKSTPDPIILDWCETHDTILLTNNRHTMPGHLADHVAAGRHVPGVFLVHPQLDMKVLAHSLEYIAGASLPNEYRDQILYPPLIVP